MVAKRKRAQSKNVEDTAASKVAKANGSKAAVAEGPTPGETAAAVAAAAAAVPVPAATAADVANADGGAIVAAAAASSDEPKEKEVKVTALPPEEVYPARQRLEQAIKEASKALESVPLPTKDAKPSGAREFQALNLVKQFLDELGGPKLPILNKVLNAQDTTGKPKPLCRGFYFYGPSPGFCYAQAAGGKNGNGLCHRCSVVSVMTAIVGNAMHGENWCKLAQQAPEAPAVLRPGGSGDAIGEITGFRVGPRMKYRCKSLNAFFCTYEVVQVTKELETYGDDFDSLTEMPQCYDVPLPKEGTVIHRSYRNGHLHVPVENFMNEDPITDAPAGDIVKAGHRFDGALFTGLPSLVGPPPPVAASAKEDAAVPKVNDDTATAV